MNELALGDDEILAFRDKAITDTRISVIIVDASAHALPIVDVNPAFEHLTGYASEEVIGKNCRLLQGPHTDPGVVARIRHAIERSEEVSATILNYRKDGTPFWNDVHISPVFDRAGKLTHFVAVQSDVSVRKRAEDNRDILVQASGILAGSLHPEEALDHIAKLVVPKLADVCLSYLQDEAAGPEGSSSPSIRLVAMESRFVRSPDTQDTAIFRHPGISDDLHGVKWVLSTGETTWFPSLTAADMAVLTNSVEEYEVARKYIGRPLVISPIASTTRIYGCLLLLMSDSRRMLNEMDVDLIRDLGRRMGTVFDNLRLFDQAQDTIRARDHFLAIAAHELRTPVVSIKGYAQFLLRSMERGTLSPDRLRHSLTTVDASANRLSTLTDDLLSVSHRSLDHLPLRRQPINIREYLTEYFSDTGSAAQKGYRSDVHLDTAVVWVNADTERLHQVLTILLSNAVKYSPPDSVITVAAESDFEGVTISVRDLGVGLLKGEEKTIFERFERTEASVSNNLPGLGIGLFLARKIVERHEGRIWAESEGRDLGTSISVWLPAIQPAQPLA
ncbi:MAG: ATP-binding protein [Thermomicrobiales bacterium]